MDHLDGAIDEIDAAVTDLPYFGGLHRAMGSTRVGGPGIAVFD
jgi:hypothetical protein